jgi:hypothetical protein
MALNLPRKAPGLPQWITDNPITTSHSDDEDNKSRLRKDITLGLLAEWGCPFLPV